MNSDTIYARKKKIACHVVMWLQLLWDRLP